MGNYTLAPVQTWVSPKDRDTAWWITKKLYGVRIPNIQMMSPDYIKFFGMPDSGDEEINKQMRDELVDVRISIGTMAEYYDEGVQISITNAKDSKEIYERVNDHLLAWKNSMEGSLNPGLIPVDDLLKLDKFAAILHPHAKRFFDKDFVLSPLARKMGSIVKIRREDFIPKNKEATEVGKDTTQHASFADVFSSRKHTGGPRWK